MIPPLEPMPAAWAEAVGLLTLARRGARLRPGDAVREHAAEPVHCVDETRAGDAFVAGVLASLGRQGVHPRHAPGRFRDLRRWEGALATGCHFGGAAVGAKVSRALDPAQLVV